jgi:hypothetical protein
MARVLNASGRLVIGYIDGDDVKKYRPHEFKFVSVRDAPSFGQQVDVFIGDTTYFDRSKPEYLVYPAILREAARQNRFHFVATTPFANIVDCNYMFTKCCKFDTYQLT